MQMSAPLVDPHQEIGRLQKEIEGYLQQIQVIEQRAMTGKISRAFFAAFILDITGNFLPFTRGRKFGPIPNKI